MVMSKKEIIFEVDLKQPNLTEKMLKLIKALHEGDQYYRPFKKIGEKQVN